MLSGLLLSPFKSTTNELKYCVVLFVLHAYEVSVSTVLRVVRVHVKDLLVWIYSVRVFQLCFNYLSAELQFRTSKG